MEMGESCSLHTSYLVENQIRQRRFNLTGASHHLPNSKFSPGTALCDGKEGRTWDEFAHQVSCVIEIGKVVRQSYG